MYKTFIRYQVECYKSADSLEQSTQPEKFPRIRNITLEDSENISGRTAGPGTMKNGSYVRTMLVTPWASCLLGKIIWIKVELHVLWSVG